MKAARRPIRAWLMGMAGWLLLLPAVASEDIPWNADVLFEHSSVEEDIVEALRHVMRLNGMEIDIQPGVEGTVTFDFVHVPLQGAFNMLIIENELEYAYDPTRNRVTVYPPGGLEAERQVGASKDTGTEDGGTGAGTAAIDRTRQRVETRRRETAAHERTRSLAELQIRQYKELQAQMETQLLAKLHAKQQVQAGASEDDIARARQEADRQARRLVQLRRRHQEELEAANREVADRGRDLERQARIETLERKEREAERAAEQEAKRVRELKAQLEEQKRKALEARRKAREQVERRAAHQARLEAELEARRRAERQANEQKRQEAERQQARLEAERKAEERKRKQARRQQADRKRQQESEPVELQKTGPTASPTAPSRPRTMAKAETSAGEGQRARPAGPPLDVTWLYKLSGIGRIEGKRYATIEGGEYRSGDSFRDMTVVAIERDKVFLEKVETETETETVKRYVIKFRKKS